MAKSETVVHITRHGQTKWNLEGKTQGQQNIPLNETGEQQAQELGGVFQGILIDRIVSSDLSRAYKTAQIIGEHIGLPVEIHSGLREQAFGQFEGKSWHEYEQHFYEATKHLSSDEERNRHKLHESMESDEEVAQRVLQTLEELVEQTATKNILAVSHGFVMLGLLRHFRFGTRDELPATSIKNGARIKLRFEENGFILEEVQGVEKVINE